MDAETLQIKATLNARQAKFTELVASGKSVNEAALLAGYKRWRNPPLSHPKIARYLKALMGDSAERVQSPAVFKPPPIKEVEIIDTVPATEVLELAAEIARDRTKADRDRLVAIKLLGMFHNLWSDNSDSGGKSESIEYHFHIGDKEPEPEPITVNAE